MRFIVFSPQAAPHGFRLPFPARPAVAAGATISSSTGSFRFACDTAGGPQDCGNPCRGAGTHTTCVKRRCAPHLSGTGNGQSDKVSEIISEINPSGPILQQDKERTSAAGRTKPPSPASARRLRNKKTELRLCGGTPLVFRSGAVAPPTPLRPLPAAPAPRR